VRSRDEYVYPAESFGSLRDGCANVVVSPDIQLKGKRFAADRFDLARDALDGPRQFGMRLVGLGCDHDVRAVCRSLKRDRAPDPATTAGDEDRFSAKVHHGCISFR
jgi:hypothetical protein